MGCQRRAMDQKSTFFTTKNQFGSPMVGDNSQFHFFGANSVIKLFKIDKIHQNFVALKLLIQKVNLKLNLQVHHQKKKFQNPPRDFSYANITQKYLSSHHKFNFVSLL